MDGPEILWNSRSMSNQTTIDHTIQRIRAFRLEQGLTINALANLAGVGTNSIRNLDEPTFNPTARTLRRLEALLAPEIDETGS